MGARSAAVLLFLAVFGPLSLLAQRVEGLELERRGRYEEAVKAYRAELGADRTAVAAWLGLERVLGRLQRLQSLIPLIDSTLAVAPDHHFVREMQLRVWSSLGDDSRVAAAARQWMEVAPESASPFRQWALAVAGTGDTRRAIDILLEGRARLGPAALAPELARQYAAVGNWTAAALEWVAAVAADNSHTLSAVAALRDTPARTRDQVVDLVAGPATDLAGHQVAAELLVVWDRALQGWALLDNSLPGDRVRAAAAVSRFVERARRGGTPEAARARGYALERLAGLAVGADAEQALLEAAQAFAEAGEFSEARRTLDRLAQSPAETPADAAAAMATLILVTIESGRLDEAERRFNEWQSQLRAEDSERLRRRLGWGLIERGELNRAAALLEGDSSIGTQAVLGWVRLYQGDLAAATELFRAAGPFALSREEATRRTSMIALLQRIRSDSAPDLGAALLWLVKGDTARAVASLSETARGLPADGGQADLLALAGDLARAAHDYGRAERLLGEALAADSLGPAAPVAEYALAVVLAETDRTDLAVRRLEHLILSHTASAVVPEARRMLNQLQGAIPQS